MSIFRPFKFMFSSKGINKGLYRLYTVWRRFGFTPEKQINFIKHYVSLLEEYKLKPTLFIPARILEKYIEQIKTIEKDKLEWGVHGYTHIDMSKLTIDETRVHIAKAIEIFDACGVAFKGFRAPYLKAGIHLSEVLSQSGRFLYDSSKSIIWDDIYGFEQKFFNWVKNFYNPMMHSQISSIFYGDDGIVGLPVSLPDDDILKDREFFNTEAVLSIWKNMLNLCHRNDELFILQLHPERIYICSDALKILIEEAKNLKPPLWMTNLSEIANWRRLNASKGEKWPTPFRGAFCITGDIDSIAVKDFIDR